MTEARKTNGNGLLMIGIVIIIALVAINFMLGYYIDSNRKIDVVNDIKMANGHLYTGMTQNNTQDVKNVYSYKRNVGDEIYDAIINGLQEADADGDGIITVEERIQYCNR